MTTPHIVESFQLFLMSLQQTKSSSTTNASKKPGQCDRNDGCRPADEPRPMIGLQPRHITHVITKFCGRKGCRTSHDSCFGCTRRLLCTWMWIGTPEHQHRLPAPDQRRIGDAKETPGIGGPPSLGTAVNATVKSTQAANLDVSGLKSSGPGSNGLIGWRTFSLQDTWDDSWAGSLKLWRYT